jgi:hypothetical protein
MWKRFVIIVGVLLMVALPCSVIAGDYDAKIKKYVDSSIRSWLAAPELLEAVAQQNINHLDVSADDIKILDAQWKAEKLIGGGDLMNSKMNNQLAAFLRGVKAASGGVIVEIFVMDNLGLNVGQTDPTGDYMQGDEAKWKKTYPVSAKAVFIDEVEEEDGMKISQTSLTVARPNGARLGAVTIAINVDKLK